MSDLIYRDFPAKLTRALEVRGLNPASLARATGADGTAIDKATIGRWLKGESLPRRPADALRLEKILDVKGLLHLSFDDFVEANDLQLSYSGMQYFPIINNNIDSPGLFEMKLAECLSSVRHSMHYTRLCEFDNQEEFYIDIENPRLLYELKNYQFLRRLINNNIVWQKVEIFYSIPQLICALQIMMMLEGTRYTVKFYPTPPQSYPVINLESFDHTRFMIGGYDPDRVYENNCVLLGDREPMRSFLERYWQNVWLVGQPDRLTFANSDKIAADLPGYNEDEWKNYKALIREKTKRLKVAPSHAAG